MEYGNPIVGTPLDMGIPKVQVKSRIVRCVL